MFQMFILCKQMMVGNPHKLESGFTIQLNKTKVKHAKGKGNLCIWILKHNSKRIEIFSLRCPFLMLLI